MASSVPLFIYSVMAKIRVSLMGECVHWIGLNWIRGPREGGGTAINLQIFKLECLFVEVVRINHLEFAGCCDLQRQSIEIRRCC